MSSLALYGGQPIRTEGPTGVWPVWDECEKEALCRVIDSGTAQYGIGPEGVALEEEIAEWMGCKYALCTINGTETMTLALKAAGIGPGDEVIMPAFTFIACPLSVLSAQAIPVPADISPHNIALDPDSVEAHINNNTRAIMVVSLYGVPADMDAMLDICERHDLLLLEDVAQAQGSQWRDKQLGTIGQIGSLSFHGAKTMTCGDGGAIVTDDKSLRDLCQSYRQFGNTFAGAEHEYAVAGANYRLVEFAAAVARVQLTRVNDLIAKRNQSAQILDEMLADLPVIRPLQFPQQVTARSYLNYAMHYQPKAAAGVHRNQFAEALKAEGIPVAFGYPTLVSELPVLAGPLRERDRARFFGRKIDYASLDFPQARDLKDNRLMLISQSWLLGDEASVRDIGRAIQKVAENIGDIRDRNEG